jgi:four helix bundle protein
MRNFKELRVWQEAMEIVTNVYKLTKIYPNEEKFGLISQTNRASVSIPSNIAEGCSRTSLKDCKRYIEISLGSAFELETQLLIACQIGLIKENEIHNIIESIHKEQRMINSFMEKLKEFSKEEKI